MPKQSLEIPHHRDCHAALAMTRRKSGVTNHMDEDALLTLEAKLSIILVEEDKAVTVGW